MRIASFYAFSVLILSTISAIAADDTAKPDVQCWTQAQTALLSTLYKADDGGFSRAHDYLVGMHGKPDEDSPTEHGGFRLSWNGYLDAAKTKYGPKFIVNLAPDSNGGRIVFSSSCRSED